MLGWREVNVVTSFRYKLSWPVLIRLVSDNVFGDVTKLITHTFPIEKAVEGMETSADRASLAIKVHVSLDAVFVSFPSRSGSGQLGMLWGTADELSRSSWTSKRGSCTTHTALLLLVLPPSLACHARQRFHDEFQCITCRY